MNTPAHHFLSVDRVLSMAAAVLGGLMLLLITNIHSDLRILNEKMAVNTALDSRQNADLEALNRAGNTAIESVEESHRADMAALSAARTQTTTSVNRQFAEMNKRIDNLVEYVTMLSDKSIPQVPPLTPTQ